MTSILDRVARARHHSRFVPSSPEEFLALALARRLGEPEAAAHYALLMSQHSADTLLSVYDDAVNRSGPGQGLGLAFHESLGRLRNNHRRPEVRRLLAIRVDRRCVAASVLDGLHLEAVRGRHLCSNTTKAESTALSFVRLMLDDFSAEVVALEQLPPEDHFHRAAVHRGIVELVSSVGLPLRECVRNDVAAAFGHPPPRQRSDARAVVEAIWPTPGLSDRRAMRCALDSLCLALYAQTERLFSYHP